eukprot:7377820-Prymnesium_polylepis.1
MPMPMLMCHVHAAGGHAHRRPAERAAARDDAPQRPAAHAGAAAGRLVRLARRDASPPRRIAAPRRRP